MSDILEGLNDAQKKIAKTLDGPVFVAAGAGSGKTFTLTKRVIWALTPGSGDNGEPFLRSLDQALIITFTEKAAAEIRERIRSALHDAGMHSMALTADSAWISTIHGMCSRILHAEAIQLGLNPRFDMVAEHVAEDLRSRAANEVLADIRDKNEFPVLMSAFDASNGRNGSESATSVLGMAKDLATRAAQRADGFDGICFPPHEASAFEVAQEVLLRYEELAAIPVDAKKEKQQLAMDKIVDSCQLMRAYLDQPPSCHTFETLSELLSVVERPDGGALRTKALTEPRKLATQSLAWAKNVAACERSSVFEGQIMEIAKRIDRRFKELKHEKGVLDNDDLLVETHRAFKEHPEIADRYKGVFKLVMIDEFQDTNAQQIEMIKLIAGDAPICTVGDAQQSIYRFRGADVEVFRKTEKEMPDVVRMDTNFRSHDDVLRLVKKVCDVSPEVEDCFVPDFMDLRAHSEGSGRYIDPVHVYYELALLYKDRNKKSDLAMELQARMLANRFNKLRENGVRPGDMAILMRRLKNVDVFQKALREYGIESIIAGGTTFSKASEVGVVAALLDVLANPKDTKQGLYPVLASEMFRLEGDDFLALATRMQETVDAPTKRRIDAGIMSQEFAEGVVPSERLKNAFEVLRQAWIDSRHKDMAAVVERVCRDSGWLARLQNLGANGRAQAANVLRAVEYIRDLCKDGCKGPVSIANEFRSWLEASKAGPASLAGGDGNAVQIMTIHASKGLEFPVVAIADTFARPRPVSMNGLVFIEHGDKLVACLKPSSDLGYDGSSSDLPEREIDIDECSTAYDWRCCAEANESLAEAREFGRLLYVGLTRAQDALVISSALEISKTTTPGPKNAYMFNEILGGMVDPGVSTFDYGGSAHGQREVIAIDPSQTLEEALEAAKSADEGIEFDIPHAIDSSENVSFNVYAKEEPEGILIPWSSREGVFSYSSVHKDCETVVYDRDESEQRDTEFDPDRATALGSAFHVLAQFVAETGNYPERSRIENVSHQYAVRPRDRKRLVQALDRWYESDLRRDTLLARSVRAEVPFFVEVTSEHGRWLEGAIDLLCDMGAGVYHVIDYKTGDLYLDESQARARHAMQAEYYAHVLLSQGAHHVTATFVLVEKDSDGQPVTIVYEFDEKDIPSLDRG